MNKFKKIKIKFRASLSRPFIIILFLILLISNQKVYSQYYSTGVENGFFGWRQIKTDKFNIIYPDFYEKKAQVFASILDTLQPIIGKSLKTTAPNIPFILHVNSSYSNGLVVWAPKRVELWMSPSPSSTIAYPWDLHLAIHEWRHAAQIQALHKGPAKTLINVFGEHIVGALIGLYIPNWFMEGDAVVAETSLSPSGRGKTPDFNMYLKAQVLDKGAYNFDKAKQGSMKDFVPNSYIFGYHMVSYARQKWGADLWGDMLENVGQNFWKFEFWGKSERRGLSINQENLYEEMINNLSSKWKVEDMVYYNSKKGIKYKILSPEKKHYSNYLSPKQVNDSTIIALKVSNFETPKLVKLSSNKENEIYSPGRIMNNYYDSRKGYLLWSEYKSHFRWDHENYSDIIEYNIDSSVYKRITLKKKLYHPSYNPKDFNIIAAIEDDSLNNQNIILMNRLSSEITRLNNIEDKAYSFPTWDDDGENIYAIETDENGKSIICINIKSRNIKTILNSDYRNIQQLEFYKNRLYYIGSYENKYQIFSLDPNNFDKEVIQHSQSRFGTLDFSINNDSIIICDYTSDGTNIVLQPLTEIKKLSTDDNFPNLPLSDTITKQENFFLYKKNIKDTIWESKDYLKSSHLFNFHSWAPMYFSIASRDMGLGISTYSQNVLGTSTFEGGYKYLLDEKRDEFFISYTFKGWYPIINTSFRYGARNIIFDTVRNYDYYSSWDEYTTKISISLPYKWTFNDWNNYIEFDYKYSFRSITPGYNFSQALTLFHTSGLGFYWSINKSMANNDINPKWGQMIMINAQRALTSDNGHIGSVYSKTFTPGIMRNHSIEIDLTLQKNTPSIYYFPNEVPFPRGVYGEYPTIYYGAKFNYHLPIAYPDFAFGALVYIKRITGCGFYDFGMFDNKFLSSIGIDLQTDFHIIRIEQPLNIGFRIGYLPQIKDSFLNILFSINI
ncbi:MAG: hypothetical protein H6Q15_1531 [Bacteroidetes bacterium]|nr:hypothetical protein [Bacteroidota bacterium]